MYKRQMLEYRKLKPVKVQVWYDDSWLGATANVERGEPLSYAAMWAESWPPREFTMRVVTEEVLAALEAPRCLLAIIDPGGFLCNALLPIDKAALQTPLLDIAARLQQPYVTAGRRDGAARVLQRIVVAGVACTKAGDATGDGQTFRARALRSARDGDFDMPELAPVHACLLYTSPSPRD